MAISVNSIGPEKLTSLLNWFKTNVDDLYAKGSTGVKNVLDNALTKLPYTPSPYVISESIPNPNGVLSKAYRNVGDVFRRNPYPALKYIDENIDENTLKNLIFSYDDATKAAKTQTLGASDNLISRLSAAFPPLTNPEALSRGDFFSIRSPRELPKEILTPQTEWMYGMRPHKNTALNKWFESQFYK